MKKLIFNAVVFLTGLASYPLLVGDGLMILHHSFPNNAVIEKLDNHKYSFVFGYGAAYPFIGWCTKDLGKNGHGWVFVTRDYNQCGKLSIFISDLIYGEHTKPIDPELAKQVCDGCTL